MTHSDQHYEALAAHAARLLFIAEHLFEMVPASAWRATGGDDGQGHYEGDYHAEKLQSELKEHRDFLGGGQAG